VIAEADRPAPGAEELLQRRDEVAAGQPVQVQQRQHLSDLRAPAAPRRQNRRGEPRPLARGRVGALVVHPRRGHLHRAGGRGDLPRPGVPVADHQPPAILAQLARMRGDVRGDLVLQRGGQHPPRPLPHDFIQARGHVLARSPVSDYLQHWRPFPPALARRLLPFDHLGRYAAPSFRSRIHNSVSYLGSALVKTTVC
jgi:hypothetical protein